MPTRFRPIAAALLLPGVLLLQACNASTAETTQTANAEHDNGNDDANDDTPYVIPEFTGEKLVLTDAEWRERLTNDQFYILRQDGTERAGTSPLNFEDRHGVFACAGCDNALFHADHKYDSGTGWPSFDQPFESRRIETHPENDFWQRIEVVCAGCDGHLGHVFEDGPRATTGLRYCINGDALVFHPLPEADDDANASARE